MRTSARLTGIVLLAVVLGFAAWVGPTTTQAASGGSITFDGTGNTSASTCDDANLDYHFSLTLNTDDGGGYDYFAILMVDGYGNALDTDFWSNTLGAYGSSDYTDFGLINSVAARPVTIYLYDITDPGGLNENTEAGASFARNGTLLAQDTIDPASVASVCGSLPYVESSGPGPDMVYIPSTAVVGSFVATTPIYFNPSADAVTTIVMEAGKTAWAYGVDASGMYYKVMLSGKFFWVPVSTMGPNYDAVWNGTPLPTVVVN